MMNKLLKILLALWLLPAAAFAQQQMPSFYSPKEANPLTQKPVQQDLAAGENSKTVYRVPLASRGNEVQLTVANTTSSVITGLEINVEQMPAWLKVFPTTYEVDKLQPVAETLARFTFRITDNAPVGARAELTFTVTDAKGYRWQKTIALQVAAPKKFKVSPNYPNPFAQSTKIRVMLPADMQVKITIFDILGRRVYILADSQHPAGSYTYKWNPAGRASGVYLCRIIAEPTNSGTKKVEVVKMMYIK